MLTTYKQESMTYLFMHKMRCNKLCVPLKLCKQLMFFLNLSETDFEKIIDFVIQLKKDKINQKKDLEVLTAKEKEVFEMVANGFTTKRIAEKLFVESSTISTHRKKIKQKLKFKSNYDWYNFYNQVRV